MFSSTIHVKVFWLNSTSTYIFFLYFRFINFRLKKITLTRFVRIKSIANSLLLPFICLIGLLLTTVSITWVPVYRSIP
ncbi:hypothetical protein RCL_jg24874.t1 [Rhizophagus clarus]|uniref:Uncharacterized protein n=1 Tax=Rhizophagus clarus TaxID=94130 RepID=A0A8H3LRJ4_9GLOM|nr:hypothetical protein RCL_jg24874.t1 [Rhizophagus clarus]